MIRLALTCARPTALRARAGLCLLTLLLTLLLAAGLGSCGYKSGLTIGHETRTVGIEIFDNSSRQRLVPNLERDLHRAMTNAVVEVLNATVVDPSEAQLVIRGSLVDFRRRSGIRNSDNELLETGIRIAVSAELFEVDSGAKETSLATTSYASRSGYVLSDSNGESAATARVLDNVAQWVVLDLFAPLAYER